MKYVGLKKAPACALILMFVLTPAAAAQAPAGGVTKEEEAEARAAAAAFAGRLRESQDFAAVARELYADDFMSRQLKGLSDWTGGAGAKTFMLEGIPSLTFERSLAKQAEVKDWERVRFAADDILYFVFLSMLSGHSFEELQGAAGQDARNILAVFPPEAVKVLNANPAASNFIMKKRGEVVVGTPEELRALAATLEEAVRLTRPRLAESLAKGKHLDANLRLLGEGFARDEVKLASGDEAAAAGYPEGTRLLRVSAPNAYSLRLVRRGGVLKVVWAALPSD
ncbi:MAG: hypothetical protein JOZ02_10495 [Acidobacteria bacterium]|nr:hypothetical protein [Acidobacteriota bacterium]